MEYRHRFLFFLDWGVVRFCWKREQREGMVVELSMGGSRKENLP